MRTYLDCPCCGDYGAESDSDGHFYDCQDVICLCKGLTVSCDAETPPYITGECEGGCDECTQ